MGEVPADQQREIAMAYCNEEIDFYENTGTYNHDRWQFLQVSAIIFGAAATVLASLESVKHAQALLIARTVTVAITTIATGINSSFSFQKEAVRQWATADLLKGERVKFKTGATPYTEDATAVNEFVTRVRDIVAAENRTWVSSSQTVEIQQKPIIK